MADYDDWDVQPASAAAAPLPSAPLPPTQLNVMPPVQQPLIVVAPPPMVESQTKNEASKSKYSGNLLTEEERDFVKTKRALLKKLGVQRAIYEKKLDYKLPTPSQAEKMELEDLDALVLDIDQMIRTRAVTELPKKFVGQAAGFVESAAPIVGYKLQGFQKAIESDDMFQEALMDYATKTTRR